jgi:hypothetical protein
MTYSPKYVDIANVPVRQVPDDYTKEEKVDALEFAETSLELDVYEGREIPAGQQNPKLVAAVKQKATCELVKGAEDPTSTKLGDLGDDGSNKTDYANSFCERYDEIVEKINESGILEDSGSSTEPYVYSTSPPDGSNNCYDDEETPYYE